VADAFRSHRPAATRPATAERTWAEASLTELISHIQTRYHEPLRDELPRLEAMVAKVLSRHGDKLPDLLPPLFETFVHLREELLEHMQKEDRVLFPVIVALEAGRPLPVSDAGAWLPSPIGVMESEHEAAGQALARMRELTSDYTPPEWACPTFRGLYFGLAQLETDMHLHVHLENHILFPRALKLARH
jgi:regulator of cell morphogenesis and NO signaling